MTTPSRDSNKCKYIWDSNNDKNIPTAKPSKYKCPPGWVQNNYKNLSNWNDVLSDELSGVCINPYLDPCWAKWKIGWGEYAPKDDFKSIAKFGYGPSFNQYPNNANIPDATPIANAVQYDDSGNVKSPNAPAQWFFPNPPPANWAELSFPDSSEAKIRSTYTCPEGWTQNKDVTDLSSGTCTSVGRYEPPSKMPDSVPNKAKHGGFGSYYYINGPLYTLYYGAKYNKWPNNNNIPSLTELLALPPSDYQPKAYYDSSITEQGVIVTPPSSFYYKERPSYWPYLNPPEQTQTLPTVIYTQQPSSNPSIQPTPKLPPYIISITPSAPVAPRPEGLTDPEGSRSIVPSTTPRPKELTDSEGSRIIAPRPNTSKSPSPSPAKTIINGIPDEYLFGGIAIFVILILLLVIMI